MLYDITWLISRRDPIKYIFEKPTLIGKIARWQVLLSKFDILFISQKAIKGQAIANYLAEPLIRSQEPIDLLFPNEEILMIESSMTQSWKLFFDRATNSTGSGIGIVLILPQGQQIPIVVKLNFPCTNNVTEYEACIVDLQVALEFNAYDLEVFRDSLLIIS